MEAKIVFLGDSCVGKTAIFNRIHKNDFNEQCVSTVNSSFFIKDIKVDSGKELKCHFWDTAGQEAFRSLTSRYVRNADGAIIVCSADNHDSIESIDEWFNFVTNNTENCEIVFLLNKIDLLENDCDKVKEAFEEKVKEKDENAAYYFTSAKTGENIETAVKELCEKISARTENEHYSVKDQEGSKNEIPKGMIIGDSLNNEPEPHKKDSCC